MTIWKVCLLLGMFLANCSRMVFTSTTFDEETVAAELALEDAIIESVQLDFRVRRDDELFITIVTDDGYKLCDGRISGIASLDQIACTFDPELFERPEIFMMTTVYSMTRKEIVSQTPARFKNPSFGMLSTNFKRQLITRKITQQAVRLAQDNRVWIGALLLSTSLGAFSFLYPTPEPPPPPSVNSFTISNFFPKSPPPPPSRKGFFFNSRSSSKSSSNLGSIFSRSSGKYSRGSLLNKWVPVLQYSSQQIVQRLPKLSDIVQMLQKTQTDISATAKAADLWLRNITTEGIRVANAIKVQGMREWNKASINLVNALIAAMPKSWQTAYMKEMLLPMLISLTTFAIVAFGHGSVHSRKIDEVPTSRFATLRRRSSGKFSHPSRIGTASPHTSRSGSRKRVIQSSSGIHNSNNRNTYSDSEPSSGPIRTWMESTKNSALEWKDNFEQLPVDTKHRWYASLFSVLAHGLFLTLGKQYVWPDKAPTVYVVGQHNVRTSFSKLY